MCNYRDTKEKYGWNRKGKRIERLFYGLIIGISLLDLILNFISDEIYHGMILGLISFFLIQQILYETLLKDMDGAFHYKRLKSEYIPKTDGIIRKRKGVIAVALIYGICVILCTILKIWGIITWPMFFIGAAFILWLNQFFIYKQCWLRMYVMKEVHCCAECSINGWDYILITTGLLFAPVTIIWVQITLVVTWLIAVFLWIHWEFVYHRYPERFSKYSNTRLSCKYCKKPCNRSVTHSLLGRYF